jgi:hypothetical protein
LREVWARLDIGVRSKTLMDMRMVYAAEFKHVKERYDQLARFAL